jgi:hypothetical protein
MKTLKFAVKAFCLSVALTLIIASGVRLALVWPV